MTYESLIKFRFILVVLAMLLFFMSAISVLFGSDYYHKWSMAMGLLVLTGSNIKG